VYSLSDYLWMIADGARASAYAAALRACVRPGDRVLEVGTGFGFFALIAAQTGAAHVDAVDTNPAIHLGPRVAAANGCADRITFHHRDISTVTLPAPADVLLIDVRGPTPFGSRALETVIGTRDRLLAPGGRIIARADRVVVAPARTPDVFRREVHAAHRQEGIDLAPVERLVFDTPVRCPIAADDLLADGLCWTTLDYRTIGSTGASGPIAWVFDRDTTVEGLAVWFEADLADGVSFSTRPGGSVSAYRQMFVPFREAVGMGTGDRLQVDLSARQVRENYLWSWRGWRMPAGSNDRQLVADQNSLAEIVLDPSALLHTSPDAVPSLGPRGAALRGLLLRIDGAQTIDELTDGLMQDAPGMFASPDTAREFVAGWIGRLDRTERGND
jgi:SAM-dependent methyltransferase